MLSKIQYAKIIFPDRKKYKIDYSDNVRDVISKLLIKDKEERLGSKTGVDEILSHSWFKGIKIDDIKNKKIKPPFKPTLSDDADTKYYKSGRDKISMADTIIPKEKIEEVKDHSKDFEKFENTSNFKKFKK